MIKERYDIAIIGSGLAGLVSGCFLAQKKLKVAIFEEHYYPGGLAGSFYRQGTRSDIGHHLIDGFDEKNFIPEILEKLEISDVKFHQLEDFINLRFLDKSYQIDLLGDFKKSKEELLKHFPTEENSINNFFSTILKIREENWDFYHREKPLFYFDPNFKNEFPTMHRYHDYDVLTYMNENFKNELLKITLCSNIGFYHRSAREMSFLSFAMAQSSFFEAGPVMVAGGGKNLVKSLIHKFKQLGGELYVKTPVIKVDTSESKATGIRVVRNNQHHNIKCDSIIANCSPIILYDKLLEKSDKYSKKIASLSHSNTMFATYIFRDNLTDDDYAKKYHTNFLTPKDNYNIENFTEGAFALTDYGTVERTKKAASVILCIDNHSHWENLSKEKYLEKKLEKQNHLLKQLKKYYPNYLDKSFHIESSTSQTINHFTGHPRGAIYGFDLSVSQSNFNRISQTTSIKNISLASAWTTPGPGFEFVMKSGEICAEKVLREHHEQV